MPKKQNPPIPKTRRHRGSGQAAVVLNGQWHYLGKHGTPGAAAAYDRLVGDWLASGRRLQDPMHELTVGELILAYWRYGEPRIYAGHDSRVAAPWCGPSPRIDLGVA